MFPLVGIMFALQKNIVVPSKLRVSIRRKYISTSGKKTAFYRRLYVSTNRKYVSTTGKRVFTDKKCVFPLVGIMLALLKK